MLQGECRITSHKAVLRGGYRGVRRQKANHTVGAGLKGINGGRDGVLGLGMRAYSLAGSP